MASTTIVSVLSACAQVAVLINGKQIHSLVVKYGFELHVPVGNVLIDMYAKSGCINDACLCNEGMPSKNVITWTTLIIDYGNHGLGAEALRAFDQMEQEGFTPNRITFLGTLVACKNAGLVEEGRRIFKSMIDKHSLTPFLEHYTCMVDLLASTGQIKEAEEFIRSMPIEPDEKLWTAFLSSCVLHDEMDLTKTIGEKLLQFNPQPGVYMLLSNYYSRLGDLESVAGIRRLMLDRGIRKENALTWIEIGKSVHVFQSGDRSHPLYHKISEYLEDLTGRMKDKGFIPNTSVVVQKVSLCMKEQILREHSEKLAIGLALICTPARTRIVIMKNLRVCLDCHIVIKFISEIEERGVVARDTNRFHRFRNGTCSCNDYC